MYPMHNVKYLMSIGTHANYVKSNFATYTFPNHWSLVTGLYEESHGIVINFYFANF